MTKRNYDDSESAESTLEPSITRRDFMRVRMPNPMRDLLRYLLISMGVALLGSGTARSQVSGTPAGRVVVVQNENSAISRAIAADYRQRRGVQYIVTIKCPDSAVEPLSETIDLVTFKQNIERPLRVFLTNHRGVDFIVLTKGIPIRLRGAGEESGLEWFSLDSRLAAIDYEEQPNAVRVDIEDPDYRAIWIAEFHSTYKAQAWANKFWNSDRRFSHAEFGGYLVTRLDGYTEADAKALISRSLQAEALLDSRRKPTGEILLDSDPRWGYSRQERGPYSILSGGRANRGNAKLSSEKAHLGDFNSDMKSATDLLRERHLPVLFEQTGKFVGHQTNLMGYFSWGSNDAAFDLAAYRSLKFAPGALGDTAVSTSGRTFLISQGGQSLIADLIGQGITGVKGYSDEPLVQAISAPSIVLDRYTRGWTLAESFYAGSALVGWQDIVIGDPLARAYPPIESE